MVTHSMVNDTLRQREERLRSIFKLYFPNPREREIYFWDDEDLVSKFEPNFVEDFIKGANTARCSGSFYFTRFDNIEILTMEFFYGVATHYGQHMVQSLLYGPDFNGKKMPFIGAGSLLSHQGYIWSLAFIMAAKHGFVYEDLEDDVYTYVYHLLFSWTLSEYDDAYRNKLDRADIYQALTRWDARIEDVKERLNDGTLSEDRKKLFQQIVLQRDSYPFTGDDKMGHFINRFGYFPPHEALPKYTNVITPQYGSAEKDTRSICRRFLDMDLKKAVVELLFFIYRSSDDKPDLSRFDFLSLDEAEKAIVVADAIMIATDEQVYNELANIYIYMGEPIPAPSRYKVTITGKPSEVEPVEKEETDHADS